VVAGLVADCRTEELVGEGGERCVRDVVVVVDNALQDIAGRVNEDIHF